MTDNRGEYDGSSVPTYARLEITFQVASATATNPSFPYDPAPPPGVTPGIGISVEAQFSRDGFQTVLTQPAFNYQAFDYAARGSQDWIYPTSAFSWKARFAPTAAGSWQYRLRATDAGGTTVSGPVSFAATAPQNGNNGPVRVSSTDARYFEYDDGTYFPALGFNMNFDAIKWDDPVQKNRPIFQQLSQNGVRMVRHWLPQWGIGGLGDNPWRTRVNSDYDGMAIAEAGFAPYGDSEVAWKLGGWRANQSQVIFLGWMKRAPATKPNTTYRVRVRYAIPSNLVAADSTKPYGLVVKYGGWMDSWLPDVGTPMTSRVSAATGGWATLEGTYTTGSTQYWLNGIHVVLENVATGTADGTIAYIDEIDMMEDLGSGQLGPNIIGKPRAAQHLYWDQQRSRAFDLMLQEAEASGVTIKLVVSGRQDWILTHFDLNGNPTAVGDDTYFYGVGRSMSKTRWLSQAWWRYVQARWGYSTAIHSWELLNEGDPYNGNHYALADEFAKYMKQWANRHPVTTSFWHSYPVPYFWGNTQYPNIDYGDLHAYQEEGQSYTVRTDVTPGLPAYTSLEFYDTAAFTTLLAGIGAKDPIRGINKPVIRGETGLIQGGNPATALAADTDGIWLHKMIWAQINAGGVIDSGYWWVSQAIFDSADGRPNYLPIFKRYYDFVSAVPLSNGRYQDAAATVSSAGLRVWGQKDATSGRAHLWIDNRSHTWKNVVDGATIPAVGGTLTIPGLPVGTYDVSWFDTYLGSTPLNQQAATDATGTLSLAMPQPISTDIAVKIQRASASPPSPTATPALTATPILTLLPTSTPTPTATPAPSPSATPTAAPGRGRPGRIRTTLTQTRGDQYTVTLYAEPTNTGGTAETGASCGDIAAVDFGAPGRPIVNAAISIPNGPTGFSNGLTYQLPRQTGTSTFTFTVRRTGPGPFTIPLLVHNACGTWETFVGAGASSS